MTAALLTVALGLALGFALQRGGFCGSSILSAVLLHRDWGGVLAAGIAVATSMLGFAALAALGLVVVDPNPLRLASAVAGGLVFGAGMVLAGGCVSGALFKAGEGRLTSMLALLGVGIGALATDGGLLAPLKKGVVQWSRGVQAPPGLHDALGVPYPVLAGLLGALLLPALLAVHARRCRRAGRPILPTRDALLHEAWAPPLTGLAIGALGAAGFLLSAAMGRNYPLGALGGVQGALARLVGVEAPANAWTLLLVAGLLPGAALSAALRRDWRLRSADPETLLVALLGGVLVGVGASVGRGCFLGNMISGLALLSLHSFVFAACAVLANQVATLLYLRGLR